MRRSTKVRLALGAIGIVTPLLFAECVLRFLPVYSGFKLAPLNAANPIPHFTPNQDITWSSGWNFRLVNKLRVNNYGFVNDQDYVFTDESPLMCIIGDSYIEAAMLPYSDTLHGRLAKKAQDRARVYSFGISGAALSQYLIWAQYVCDEFKPDFLTFVIIGNDFDESLNKYKRRHAGWFYVEDDAGRLELELFGFSPSSLRKLARKSALIRYLVWNCNLEAAVTRLFTRNREFVGNVEARREEADVKAVRRATDQFLIDLRDMSDLPPEKVLFVVDGIRPELYSATNSYQGKDPYVATIRRYFIEQATKHRYGVIDMNTKFRKHYAENGQRFEWSFDYHWNEIGHAVAGFTRPALNTPRNGIRSTV